MGAPDPENPLFLGFSVLREGDRDHGLSRKGPDHGVGVDPETVICDVYDTQNTHPNIPQIRSQNTSTTTIR